MDGFRVGRGLKLQEMTRNRDKDKKKVEFILKTGNNVNQLQAKQT